MTHMTISLRSQSLGKQTEVGVLLPAGANRNHPVKTLWALHGMTDDHTGWLRRSFLEVLADQYGVCVVMPNADLSFYVNMAAGGDYHTWIAEELPQLLLELLPLSGNREDQYIAGISMGGYGAFQIALNHPERYHTAVSLSGPMRIAWIHRLLADERLAEQARSGGEDTVKRECARLWAEEGIPERLTASLMKMASDRTVRHFHAMFGRDPVLSGNHYDILHQAKELAARPTGLRLMAFCGEDDLHYVSNLHFQEYAAQLGLDYSLILGQGDHNWIYWNRVIPVMMARLFA